MTSKDVRLPLLPFSSSSMSVSMSYSYILRTKEAKFSDLLEYCFAVDLFIDFIVLMTK